MVQEQLLLAGATRAHWRAWASLRKLRAVGSAEPPSLCTWGLTSPALRLCELVRLASTNTPTHPDISGSLTATDAPVPFVKCLQHWVEC